MAENGNKPYVSVVLPVFNGATTVQQAVDSIIVQDYKNWEMIIINDGSTDNTSGLLANLKDTRIKVYHIPRSGISRALNFGIRISSGRYIARMDADDVSPVNRLSCQVDYLENHEATGLVSGLVSYIGNKNRHAGYAHYVDTINAIITHDDIYNKRFFESPFAHPSVMFRKSLVSRYGGYCEEALPEDYELWLRWLQNGVKMHKLEISTLLWYDPITRLSRTHFHYSAEKFFEVKAHYFMQWLYETQHESPDIWIFGCGKEVNRRLKPFLKKGLRIKRFIDVKKREDTSKYIYYQDLPRASIDGSRIILSMVSDRNGRKDIAAYLSMLGYREGTDYFLMA